jgi:hypothetical protein
VCFQQLVLTSRRVFWENGFKTVAAVANADPQELLPVLLQAQASKVRFGDDRNEVKFKEKLLEKAHIITESANRIWRTFRAHSIPFVFMFDQVH